MEVPRDLELCELRFDEASMKKKPSLFISVSAQNRCRWISASTYARVLIGPLISGCATARILTRVIQENTFATSAEERSIPSTRTEFKIRTQGHRDGQNRAPFSYDTRVGF